MASLPAFRPDPATGLDAQPPSSRSARNAEEEATNLVAWGTATDSPEICWVFPFPAHLCGLVRGVGVRL